MRNDDFRQAAGTGAELIRGHTTRPAAHPATAEPSGCADWEGPALQALLLSDGFELASAGRNTEPFNP